jgi:hypothetical protein
VLNHVKIFTEFQIFGVLLVCLIIQVHDTDFDTEIVSIDAYGLMQTVLLMAIIPTVIYYLVRVPLDFKVILTPPCIFH